MEKEKLKVFSAIDAQMAVADNTVVLNQMFKVIKEESRLGARKLIWTFEPGVELSFVKETCCDLTDCNYKTKIIEAEVSEEEKESPLFMPIYQLIISW